MGQGIAPVPGVIVPFHSQSQQSFGAAQVGVAGPGAGIRPGRRYHDQQKYRPEYGVAEGYALPYVVSGGYGTPAVSGGGVSSTNSSESRSMMGVAGQGEASLRDGPAPVADAPSGNRPPYRGETDRQSEAASTGPNVIQSHEPVLVLVMKNGGRRKVRNYALTPQTLIDLDEAASGKEVEIPLGEINLAATKKAAAEAGLSFAVPRG